MCSYKDVRLEAGHYLPSAPGTANARLQRHPFPVRVIIEAEADPATGYVLHFSELERAIADAREQLDHPLLNEVEVLSAPTLKRIAIWLWNRLQNQASGLADDVARECCAEGCFHHGLQQRARLAAV